MNDVPAIELVVGDLWVPPERVMRTLALSDRLIVGMTLPDGASDADVRWRSCDGLAGGTAKASGFLQWIKTSDARQYREVGVSVVRSMSESRAKIGDPAKDRSQNILVSVQGVPSEVAAMIMSGGGGGAGSGGHAFTLPVGHGVASGRVGARAPSVTFNKLDTIGPDGAPMVSIIGSGGAGAYGAAGPTAPPSPPPPGGAGRGSWRERPKYDENTPKFVRWIGSVAHWGAYGVAKLLKALLWLTAVCGTIALTFGVTDLVRSLHWNWWAEVLAQIGWWVLLNLAIGGYYRSKEADKKVMLFAKQHETQTRATLKAVEATQRLLREHADLLDGRVTK